MKFSSLAVALLFVACSSNKDAAPTQAGAKVVIPEAVATTEASAKAEPVSRTCAIDGDCGATDLCVANQCKPVELADCSGLKVQFGYDSTDIVSEDQRSLERVARCVKAKPEIKVTIEGNADERGTTEYNIALGQRRAQSIEQYLKRLGAPSERLKSISYGEEKPECTESNEECWAKNRRASLLPN